MNADSTRALVSAFASALEHRNWPAFGALLAPDVVYELPQTRERIRGRDMYVRFNAEYPGDWHVEPHIVLADNDNGCLLFRWTLDGKSSPGICVLRVPRRRHREGHGLLAGAIRATARA